MRQASDTIYLIRHGETVWNVAGRLQGGLDSPLTRRGQEQAGKIGRRLAQELAAAGLPADGHVSPLGRAKETAARIATHVRVPFHDEPRLREVSLGAWDGLTPEEIDAEYPDAVAGAEPFDWCFRSPDGETFEAACARVQDWLSSLTQPTVAVSHGLTGRLIRGAYLGLTRREMLTLPASQDGFIVLSAGSERCVH